MRRLDVLFLLLTTLAPGGCMRVLGGGESAGGDAGDARVAEAGAADLWSADSDAAWPAGCGNGVKEDGEACDDGNHAWCDGCAGDCSATESQLTLYLDADGDGYGDTGQSITAHCVPVGYVKQQGDCQDGDAKVNPGAGEICGNNVDDDCDGGPEPSCGGDLLTYTFNDGKATDSSGNGHDGTFHFNPGCDVAGKPPAAVTGKYGQGMGFVSGCARIDVADASSLFPGNKLTVEAWVYREVGGNGDREHLFGDHIWTDEPNGELTMELTPKAELRLLTNTGGSGTALLEASDSKSTVPQLRWVYLAVTWDGSTARFYIDGQLSDSAALSATPIEKTTNGVHHIGSLPGSHSFKGVIDELRLSSYAKTAAEIQATMRHDSTAAGK